MANGGALESSSTQQGDSRRYAVTFSLTDCSGNYYCIMVLLNLHKQYIAQPLQTATITLTLLNTMNQTSPKEF